MKHISLAARYRPQTFQEVAGQDLIKTVLTRASQEDRVAAGYLFSGTRGVGKTTLARIFAKALNCEHAPSAEPCNQCEQCRSITEGVHPDVVEIDGASNNSVEDARELRESIGFAPMQGRYKIFIIDEAHMLSRNAFNALLKTLEEPPRHVVFIFATTEIFRFPATILSRCQVFTFHHLSEEAITAHLSKVLDAEGIQYASNAVKLIARRAAGSVRDGMSLLDQTLAYATEALDEEIVRTVLGLAGLDALHRLFTALAHSDCGDVALFTRELASKEVDMGFFVRELTDYLRSLFLLRQCGKDVVARLGVPDSELDFLQSVAANFTPTYLHAAWQMVLESQRSITTSQEPVAALELLLMNLALLPSLMPSITLMPGSTPQQSAPAPQSIPAAPPPNPTPHPGENRSAQAQQTRQEHGGATSARSEQVRPAYEQPTINTSSRPRPWQEQASPKPAWNEQARPQNTAPARPQSPVYPQFNEQTAVSMPLEPKDTFQQETTLDDIRSYSDLEQYHAKPLNFTEDVVEPARREARERYTGRTEELNARRTPQLSNTPTPKELYSFWHRVLHNSDFRAFYLNHISQVEVDEQTLTVFVHNKEAFEYLQQEYKTLQEALATDTSHQWTLSLCEDTRPHCPQEKHAKFREELRELFEVFPTANIFETHPQEAYKNN